MRRRAQIQAALVQETNFRRAMENSMPTGMRAMDLEGRITYVNAAFCQMTGFAESELVGRLPPFPYWPPDRIAENSRLLQQELQGRSPAGGIEVKVMRKDGSLFDARMYVSPLIDPGPADRLDDQHDQHHRGQAHPRPALGLARTFHHRAGRAGGRGVGAVGAAGRTAVRQPLVPAVVRRRRARARLLAGGVPAPGLRARGPTRRSTTCRACRRRNSPKAAPTRARSSSSRCRSGSTCARATCSGPTAGWRRC
jgi:PAS domain S-box-containing protein